MKHRTAVALLLLSALGTVAHAEPARRIEPLVYLHDGQIKACGVRFGFVDIEVAMKLERAGATAELVVSAQPAADVRLATASQDTSRLITGPASDGSWRGVPDPTAGAMLWQELMIGGARITIGGPTERPRRLVVPGPLPQQVRASYLNCAGDLFGP
jgi:hypothetical protein